MTMGPGSIGSFGWESDVRVLVLGTAGVGKTTCARTISGMLGVPHIELDALRWGPNWKQVDREHFVAEVNAFQQATNGWVVDGNYRSVRDSVAAAADLIVWLDHPLWVCQWRLVRRTTIRMFSRQELWNGNRDTLRSLIGSRFDLFRWSATEHRRLRKEVPDLCNACPSTLCVRIAHEKDLVNLLASDLWWEASNPPSVFNGD